MKKCLVTKLKASTGNTQLLKAGELRMNIVNIDSPNENTQSLLVGFNETSELEIIGDGYFTDSTLNANLGKKITANVGNNTIYISNGNYTLSIYNKYAITVFKHSKNEALGNKNKIINIEGFKSCKYLTDIAINGRATGNISALSEMTSMKRLFLSNNPNLTGDISALSGMTLLNFIYAANNPNLTGDISALSGMTLLTTLDMSNNNLTGDISALSGMTLLTTLHIGNESNKYTSVPKCANIASINTLTKLKEIYFYSMNILGDVSKISPNLILLSLKGSTSNCTWSSRPTSSNIFAVDGVLYMDNIDNLLIDFSQCLVPTTPASAWYKIINLKGNRTSASDEALAALQSKGYTINIR